MGPYSLNLQYNFPSTENNGKISSQTDVISGETVTYAYDSLNRLATASSSANWGQSYTYDGFGNMTDQTSTVSAPDWHVVYDATTNRRAGESADLNGNLSVYGNGITVSYDVENRVIQAASGTAHYAYAPGNKRVWRNTSAIADEFTFWSPSGRKFATYTVATGPSGPGFKLTSQNAYFGGLLMAKSQSSSQPLTLVALTQDRLGSIGTYYPYGQNRSGNPPPPLDGTEKFTGYFRDAETGLDYAKNRYHAPGTGRFMTADPLRASARPTDPTSWNRYAYTHGDPINRVDRSGLVEGDEGCDPDEDDCGPGNGDGGGSGGGGCAGDGFTSSSTECTDTDGGGGGDGDNTSPPPMTCDQLLAQWIDMYLQNYNGMTGHGSPLLTGLATWGAPGTDAGTFLVSLGKSTGVDPAFILGIARSESSLATNPNVRGGQYNIYGNSAHFTKNFYTNYFDPTKDAFNLISKYVATGVGLDTRSMYVTYEGESNTLPDQFNRQLGTLNSTDSALFGNLNNVKYNCDDTRRAKLAAALGSK